MGLRYQRPADQLRAILMRGVDGDTVHCLVAIGWSTWKETNVRIMGIESWELDSANKEFARRAAARITEAYAMTEVILQPRGGGVDLYGRIRADVATRDGDLAAWLVNSGLAWRIPHQTPR